MPGSIFWYSVIKKLSKQWVDLINRKKVNDPNVPKIPKDLSVIKLKGGFVDFLHHMIGVRNIPLVYITREVTPVPEAAPSLLMNQMYLNYHGSV